MILRTSAASPALPARLARNATLLAALIISGCAAAADDGEGEATSNVVASDAVFPEMDTLYERFTRAYRLGEPDSVVVLYTDEPLYLPVQGPILQGRELLRGQFLFLESIRAQNGVALITFESAERGTSGDLAWDVGYYTLIVEDAAGRRRPPSRGKFTTVWSRDATGQWLIHVDAFSPAPPPEE